MAFFNRKKLNLYSSEKLAVMIVDTLVDHGFVEKIKFEDAVASAKWEIDAQSAMGRVILADDAK